MQMSQCNAVGLVGRRFQNLISVALSCDSCALHIPTVMVWLGANAPVWKHTSGLQCWGTPHTTIKCTPEPWLCVYPSQSSLTCPNAYTEYNPEDMSSHPTSTWLGGPSCAQLHSTQNPFSTHPQITQLHRIHPPTCMLYVPAIGRIPISWSTCPLSCEKELALSCFIMASLSDRIAFSWSLLTPTVFPARPICLPPSTSAI